MLLPGEICAITKHSLGDLTINELLSTFWMTPVGIVFSLAAMPAKLGIIVTSPCGLQTSPQSKAASIPDSVSQIELLVPALSTHPAKAILALDLIPPFVNANLPILLHPPILVSIAIALFLSPATLGGR